MFNKVLRDKYQVLRSCGLKNIFRTHLLSTVFVLCSLFFSLSGNAQCAMCRASLETEGDSKKGEALNDGIVYLMAFPYILVGGVGYVIYRTRKQKMK